MNRFRPVFLIGCFAALAIVVSACASATYTNNKFNEDPLVYLIGEWEGTVNIPGSPIPEWERILIISYQASSPVLEARYGIPGTRYQGRATVYVEQLNGSISITFRTGSGSTATLWLQRMGDEYVLNGTLKTPNLSNSMILRKKK